MTQTTRQASESNRELNLAKALKWGILGGVTTIFIASVGMIEAFAERVLIQPYLTLSYISLALIPFALGYITAKPPPTIEGMAPIKSDPRDMLTSALTGAIGGIMLSLFVLLAQAVNLRDIFVNISPRMVEILTFGQSTGIALILLVLGGGLFGFLGSLVVIIPDKWRQPIVGAMAWALLAGLFEVLFQPLIRVLHLEIVSSFLFSPLGGLKPSGAVVIFIIAFALYTVKERQGNTLTRRFAAMSDREKRPYRIVGIVALVIALAFLPIVGGAFISDVLDSVGIFLLMGLGLNIVVGFSGMLDLGYVAFFAVGAYVTAVLTSPTSPAFSPELIFWAALPFVVLAAAFAGILVGTPVLRMRGDYLAIVTLGFGEIARLLFQSEWLVPYVGGAQGILSIPNIIIGPLETKTPALLFYPIAAFVLLAIYVSWALKGSRIGRAWMAMREDEPVAEVMGIDIVQAKLSAFIAGAVLASFGGALFAVKIGSIFPRSFDIVVSIQVLVLIIVGGMGNIPGVIAGAFIVIGLPEILREFSEFKFLMYGALLIYMMLQKPAGFFPAKERMRELHGEEVLQDVWLKKQEENGSDPSTAAAHDSNTGLA
ncbi:MAG: branched-chain amino acid ABC transporter permease [Candidatus Promineifilaceae bacterium]